MSTGEPNGKATAGLVLQAITFLAFVVTPLILMFNKVSTLETKLEEVETQFRAADEFRNINLASQMRYNALIWQRLYGETFPPDIYFPSISHK